jgi:NitT/TauT family transport system permease protein
MNKQKIKIGYLPIVDHLILGISAEKDNPRFTNVEIEPVRYHSWSEIAKGLTEGEVDGAFIMAPFAMKLKATGVPIKTILLGHREGLGFVISSKISSLKKLEGKTIGIPSDVSTHTILLHKYLKDKNIDFKKIKTLPMAPPEFVHNLASGKIAGYLGSEPFGAEAEHKSVGRLEVMSKDIQKHHIDCILVMHEHVLENKSAIQELTDSLVNSGVFMTDKPKEASRIGSIFLEQPMNIIKDVLNEKKMRVSFWDLLPIKKEFEEMQNYAVDTMHLFKKKAVLDTFIDDSFAKESYERMSLKRGVVEKRKIQKEKIGLPILVFVLFIAIWWIASLNVNSTLLPSPLQVLDGTIDLALEGSLFKHVYTSLYRVFSGFILAVLFGVPLGLLIGMNKKLKYAFDPLIQVLRPISPIAWIPLAILWFGVGDTPAIFIIFITAFFPIFLASNSAIKNIDPVLIKAARNFGTSKKGMFLKVILPASFPYIMVGLRVSLGISWVIIVAAEMVGMSSGLGYLILDARNFLRTDLIISGMIVIGLIGFGLDAILNWLESKVKKRWSYKEVSEI